MGQGSTTEGCQPYVLSKIKRLGKGEITNVVRYKVYSFGRNLAGDTSIVPTKYALNYLLKQ